MYYFSVGASVIILTKHCASAGLPAFHSLCMMLVDRSQSSHSGKSIASSPLYDSLNKGGNEEDVLSQLTSLVNKQKHYPLELLQAPQTQNNHHS